MKRIISKSFLVVVIVICCILFSQIHGAMATEAPLFTVKFQAQTLPEALSSVADQTQTKIKFQGNSRVQDRVSMLIENTTLPEIIGHILKRYRVENYAIAYGNNDKEIEIRSFASKAPSESMIFPPSNVADVIDSFRTERFFTKENFEDLQAKDPYKDPGKEFTESDYDGLMSGKFKPYKDIGQELSNEDFERLVQAKTEDEQHSMFSEDSFLRVIESQKSDKGEREFSAEDFMKIQENQ